jgi:ABC-type amino acid transport substrate-binding protein
MQEGQYDCIVGGITITPARQQILAWSDPYMTTTLSLIIDAFRSPEIRGIADLKDAVVGVQAATTDYDVAIAMQTRREIKDVRPDLNTLFCQAIDIMTLLAKFGRPWHYASGGRGALRRGWVAALPAAARSA